MPALSDRRGGSCARACFSRTNSRFIAKAIRNDILPSLQVTPRRRRVTLISIDLSPLRGHTFATQPCSSPADQSVFCFCFCRRNPNLGTIEVRRFSQGHYAWRCDLERRVFATGAGIQVNRKHAIERGMGDRGWSAWGNLRCNWSPGSCLPHFAWRTAGRDLSAAGVAGAGAGRGQERRAVCGY